MLERFKKEKIIIRLENVEDAKEFFDYAISEGIKLSPNDIKNAKFEVDRYKVFVYYHDGDLEVRICNFSDRALLELDYSTWQDYKKQYVHVWKNASSFKLPEERELNTEYVIKAIYSNEEKRVVVIKWKDDTTTKSTCSEEDHFDITVGFAMAYMKKVYGGKKKLLRAIKKLTAKEKK